MTQQYYGCGGIGVHLRVPMLRPLLGEERVPGRASGLEDGRVAAGEHAVAEPAVAQVLPDPLHGVETLWGGRRW